MRASLFAGLALFSLHANAGLLSDDEARKDIQALAQRVVVLEDSLKNQTKFIVDLQGQIESLNVELRRMRGLNEELGHALQDSEKRQKDFYIDLDARLRRFEVESSQVNPAAPAEPKGDDPVQENRVFEAAYGLHRAKSYQSAITAFQDFQKKYPASVHVPNTHFLIGENYLALKDYSNAELSFLAYVEVAPSQPKASDALLNVATAQLEMKQKILAKKTLKKLIADYPESAAAATAKKRLVTLK